ncbi:hypothetical protein [Burkholderia semiarida]|uniref:hypothetical protein n=1 Tax=Burkholderia semiarida TaxID=2843303 RepID=UPI003877EBC7
MPVTLFRIPLTDICDFINDAGIWSASTHVDASPMVVHRLISETDPSSLPYFAFVDERFFKRYPRWGQFVER